MIRKFNYINGYLGTKKHLSTYTMIFKNKPLSIALKQEIYWQGGNDNELNV
jgi:hypothetical protein